ncbi:MAG TPA: WYL domain-containing protein [Leptospiraceae bacterium]|nr:WYL domain-containing protein [Leptospiraceae bacterium]HMW06636.1 WYL domain-containing protein [Leptospiraceae bacterium]HMX34270.1 WYL domain-containing protein [Leptospiraceae bacterium]HMY32701.1 WYL domain-containing protein [Leptospiraceae bacterium]HMZ64891.1 WYL domain-containing protein [Leptospiraceae bacterium]
MQSKDVEHLEQIKFEQMETIFQIIGMIESKSALLEKSSKPMTREKMEEYLNQIEGTPKIKRKNKEDSYPDKRRQIANVRKIFNRLSNKFHIEGNRLGTSFINLRTGSNNQKGLKEDNAYQTLLVIYLSLLLYKGTIHLDFLYQFLELEFPFDFLTSFQYSIHKKINISFHYRSDRNNHDFIVDPFLPVKIYFKDNHWFLVGWDLKYNSWNQYLIHSIKKLTLSSKKLDLSKIPNFDFIEYRKSAFAGGVLNNSPIHTVEIEVPLDLYEAVRKRRREGNWEKKENFYIWKLQTYDLNEIFDYIFRWNGRLKIKSPDSVKKEFQTKIRSFLE